MLGKKDKSTRNLYVWVDKNNDGTVNSRDINSAQGNIPTFRNGGMINYTGQSHNGPDGGIPIDDNGNPSIQSGNQPTGLTEDKEVAWKLPDGNTFIFSDSLGYAPVAKRIYSKYSKRLGKQMEKTDAISMKGLTQEFNDLAAEQEISKKMDGQKTGIKGTYRYGGTIDGEDGEESTKPTVSQPRSVSTKNISGIDMKFIPNPKPVKGKSGPVLPENAIDTCQRTDAYLSIKYRKQRGKRQFHNKQ